MEEYVAQKAIAEGYLDEMLEAERARDFGAWSKQWDASDLEGLDEEVFQRDLDDMDRVFAAYRSRAYLGVLKGTKDVAQENDMSVSL